MSGIKRFRVISLIEGLSYLILVFYAMPQKYLYSHPEAVKFFGMAHGVLFILFCLALYTIYKRYPLSQIIKLFIYSLIPFGFLLIERDVTITTPTNKLKKSC